MKIVNQLLYEARISRVITEEPVGDAERRLMAEAILWRDDDSTDALRRRVPDLIRAAVHHLKLKSRMLDRKKAIAEKPKLSRPWTSTADLLGDTYAMIGKLPVGIDFIVGVPRSGMLPASALATALHLPLFSIDDDDGDLIDVGGGDRIETKDDDLKHGLVIDDTVCRGRAMKKVNESLKRYAKTKFTTAAVYASPGHEGAVDIFSKLLPDPHYLEWNFFNSCFAAQCAFDIDGILCEDAPLDVVNDEAAYLEFLSNAPLLHAVRKNEIPLLITARLEKHRAVTEAWLEFHNIRFRQLAMGPWETHEERQKPGEVAQYKAAVLRGSNLQKLVESDVHLSAAIHRMTKKEIICPPARRVFL
tara:strand:+ start:1424 stop:2503 length:1080 start_codon:yes stop_codon:yes gene_type:complete